MSFKPSDSPLRKILPDRGIGSFGLRPNQSYPLNAYVALAVLQKALGSGTEVNAIFASAASPNLSNSNYN